MVYIRQFRGTLSFSFHLGPSPAPFVWGVKK